MFRPGIDPDRDTKVRAGFKTGTVDPLVAAKAYGIPPAAGFSNQWAVSTVTVIFLAGNILEDQVPFTIFAILKAQVQQLAGRGVFVIVRRAGKGGDKGILGGGDASYS